MDKIIEGANIYLVITTYILMAITAYLTLPPTFRRHS